MAKQTYHFSGKACYISDKPNPWGKYDMLFFADKPTRDAMKATGFKNKTKINDEEKLQKNTPAELHDQQYYTLRSTKGPYPILDTEGKPMAKLVGNGSDVTVKLTVELFTSPVHGPSARSELEGVVVDRLIEYVRPAEATAEAKVELPA